MLRNLGKPSQPSRLHNMRIIITEPQMFADGCFPNESRRIDGRWVPDEEEIRVYISKHGHHPGAKVQLNIGEQHAKEAQ